MKESQNTEFKSSWRDEYLKHICAFANTRGGSIFNGKEYLEVLVPQSSIPISYKGVYYVKSGSTKQELKGGELQHFLLKKMGRTFDEISILSYGIRGSYRKK